MKKKLCELKFCEPGGCVFSNKLKMACARNLLKSFNRILSKWNYPFIPTKSVNAFT